MMIHTVAAGGGSICITPMDASRPDPILCRCQSRPRLLPPRWPARRDRR
ncbi:MAG: hypothetical protein R3D29_10570 [Nitratireductor sp.]